MQQNIGGKKDDSRISNSRYQTGYAKFLDSILGLYIIMDEVLIFFVNLNRRFVYESSI
jgi:hypothetical protein